MTPEATASETTDSVVVFEVDLITEEGRSRLALRTLLVNSTLLRCRDHRSHWRFQLFKRFSQNLAFVVTQSVQCFLDNLHLIAVLIDLSPVELIFGAIELRQRWTRESAQPLP
mgnify:CR=1 FL=1